MPKKESETRRVQGKSKSFSKDDIEKNKGMAVVAYFIFFVPLLIDGVKDSPFVKFHVKQSLALVISCLAISFLAIIPIIGWFIIGPLGWLLVLVLWIIGLINAINGKAEPVPLIGKYAQEWLNF